MPDGPHTVSFRAEDALGNKDGTPASRSFTVDTTVPETTIDSGPGPKARKGKVQFAFSSSEAGSSLECSLVPQGRAAKFEACSSPQRYRVKRKGKAVKYVFSVRATDAAGNADQSPATDSFKVGKKTKK
jgi:hypothetical protein